MRFIPILCMCLLLNSALANEAAVNGSNKIGHTLFKVLSQEQSTENLVFSPFSIASALAMVTAGAAGKTQTQLVRAFGLKRSDTGFQNAFGRLNKQLASPSFKIANRLWVDQRFSILPSYAQLTQKIYDAKIDQQNFQTDPSAARNVINGWVAEKTNQRIKDLFGPRDLNRSTRLVLANAVFFKSTWKTPFEKKLTEEKPFLVLGKNGEQIISAPTMQKRGKMQYTDTQNFQALALPYSENGLLALILLPKAKSLSALSSIQNEFDSKRLKRLLNSELHMQELSLSLPKFSFLFTADLNPMLKKIGIIDAFSPSLADFSKINGRKDLNISKAVHKAFIEVNEEGTEAAAATGMGMDITAMPEEPTEFKADHPFLFFVLEKTSGSVLFAARVMNPLKTE